MISIHFRSRNLYAIILSFCIVQSSTTERHRKNKHMPIMKTPDSLQSAENTPWTNGTVAQQFTNNFLAGLVSKPSFSDIGESGASLISDTVKSAMDRMDRSRESSSRKMQALNIAFASGITQAVMEGQGVEDLDHVERDVGEAINSAFQQDTLIVNNAFIDEIQSLIAMFAEASMN